jgi:uncharacterized protein YndB with AHSA1/START domain
MDKVDKVIVERSIWINAPRDRVWQAVTDPAQIPQWFLPATFGAQMKRDDTGKLAVCLGEMNVDVAILERIDAPRQVTSRSLPDGLLATTYTLEEEEEGTRVTVTMTGFESLLEDARYDRQNLSGAAWEKALENLKAAIAGTERPFPQSGVAPLFGYCREIREMIAVERSIWINAPRERVWSAVTDPKKIEKWFSPGTPWTLSALEIGGRLFVRNAETGEEMYTQIIDVLDPPRRFATRSAPPEIPHVTNYILEEENGGTRLTLIHTGYELEPIENRYNNMEMNAFGFGSMLENMKASVEDRSLPNPGGF